MNERPGHGQILGERTRALDMRTNVRHAQWWAMGLERMEVVFFRGPGRLQPVQQFLEELGPAERRAAAENQVDRLAMLSTDDPPLPAPWDEQVEAELRALRVRVGRHVYRVVYRRFRN